MDVSKEISMCCNDLIRDIDFEPHGFEALRLDGWDYILQGSLSLIWRYAEINDLKVNIVQVKEKFGLLRVYQQGGDKFVRTILDIAEAVSGCICEVCGKQGQVKVNEGWARTRCSEHENLFRKIQIETRPNRDRIESYARSVAIVVCFFQGDAVRWVNQECLGLGGRRPLEQLSSVEGCRKVRELVKRLEYGVGV